MLALVPYYTLDGCRLSGIRGNRLAHKCVGIFDVLSI
jgi:hypothetical protein